MDTFLHLPPEERRLACQQVDAQMHLQAVSVEKDCWVCWTLRELFNLPGAGGHLTFKGGTSLSKAWKLIKRFSEDIDLVVGKDALGFGGGAGTEKAPGKKTARTAGSPDGILPAMGARDTPTSVGRPDSLGTRRNRLETRSGPRHGGRPVFAV